VRFGSFFVARLRQQPAVAGLFLNHVAGQCLLLQLLQFAGM
jgi:hypothetical protein